MSVETLSRQYELLSKEQKDKYTEEIELYKQGRAKVGPLEGTKNSQNEMIDRLATCARTFNNIVENEPPATHQYNVSGIGGPRHDPLFWYCLGMNHCNTNYVWGPGFGFHHHHHGEFGIGGGGCGGGCGGGNGDGALIAVVLAVLAIDIVALVGGACWIGHDSNKASEANTRRDDFHAIAKELTEHQERLSKEVEDAFKEVGTCLKNIGDREANKCTAHAVGTGFVAISLVGVVHLTVTAIAYGILQSCTASAGVLKAMAFCSFSFSPPFLIALATIAAVGLLIYSVNCYNHRNKAEEDKMDAYLGLRQLTIIRHHFLPKPSAPPAS